MVALRILGLTILMVPALTLVHVFSGCSGDGGSSSQQGSTGNGGNGAGGGSGATGGTGGSDTDGGLFDGAVSQIPECVDQKWTTVSRACWNCVCELCTAETVACGDTCWPAVDCAIANDCLKPNILDELNCINMYCSAEFTDAGPVAGWDQCLVGKGNYPVRACSTECSIMISQ